MLLLTEPELRLLRQFAELAFLPAACTAGLRFGIFALFLLYGHPAADTLRPQGLRTFPAKSRSKRKTSIFYDFSCIAFVILVL